MRPRNGDTACDVANLQEYPGTNGTVKGQKQGVNIKDFSKNGSWNN
jgi:hypothetical protein